ncbi:MAG TPA: hypothetical protein VGD48_39130 [Kutzneria sp.]
MLEFLQPLVDLIAKALPALAKRRERDEAAKLGAELFLLYVQCNEALVQGELIVQALEQVRAGGSTRYLAQLIDEQLHKLKAVAIRLNHWQFEFHVLEGRAVLDLIFMTDWKISALHTLRGAILDHGLPLRSTGVLIDDDGVIQLGPGPSHPAMLGLNYQLSDELAADTVPLDQPFGPDVPALVERYLTVRKPREQLDRIRDSLEKIRAALVANFTVSDILLRAGDPRGNRRWPT